MIPVEEAQKLILYHTEALDRDEIDLFSSSGYVLADDLFSDIDIPPFDKAAMDGYAVRRADCGSRPSTLKVRMNLAAGTYTDKEIGTGECAKIMTGAPVPPGADAVLMVEETKLHENGTVVLLGEIKEGQHICRKGEDIEKGKLVLKAGTKIGAPEVAILASVGRATVPVYRKPRVAILSTGNEIVEPHETPRVGTIRNSNGPMLVSMARGLGCETQYLGIAEDTESELQEKIASGMKSDVLLLSGGVSMGEYDLVPDALSRSGARTIFHRVFVKPGKPLLFAKRNRTAVFGVPGNPVSNFTTFHLFIKPALKKLMGDPDHGMKIVDAIAEIDFENRSERVHVIPSRYSCKGSGIYVTPFKLNGSADIVGCTGANCLSVLEAGRKYITRGDTVKILFLQ
jgi:molybdopterin molybdotransferase